MSGVLANSDLVWRTGWFIQIQWRISGGQLFREDPNQIRQIEPIPLTHALLLDEVERVMAIKNIRPGDYHRLRVVRITPKHAAGLLANFEVTPRQVKDMMTGGVLFGYEVRYFVQASEKAKGIECVFRRHNPLG